MTALSEPVGSRANISGAPTAPPAALFERALTLAAMGGYEEATKALRKVIASAPEHGPAWHKLAALLRLAGKEEEASAANVRAIKLTSAWPPAKDARSTAEIDAGEHALSESVAGLVPEEQLEALRDHLRAHETDAAALRLLARGERGRGNLLTACDLFERALELASDFQGAREDLILVLGVLGEHGHALSETRRLVSAAPENITYRVLHAEALRSVGDLEGAITIIEALIQERPTSSRLRCTYARMLHFAGRPEDSAREFRTVLEMRPNMGEAWWGLAELRGGFLTSIDVTSMRENLRDAELDQGSRVLMQFALGRVLEQAGNFAGSFAAYEAGAALGRDQLSVGSDAYDPAKETREVRRRSTVFTAPTVAKCAAPQSHSPTPIFIVGMPRAGSTLVEQILASHSLVEATMELPVIGNLTRDVSRSRLLINSDAYPDCMPELSPEQLAELGARYIDEAGVYRKTTRPYFIDKCPWNWLDAGFIRMILPQAKIVDVRREPMAACFAMYKQNFSDIGFPNDFDGLARYYTEYVELMAHYEGVMPGRIHLVQYERLVEDTEREIRRLLDWCGLPFEESCLHFWETERTIATPSAEQVRRPVFREALEQWRNFEPWLGGLKQALKEAEAEAAVQPQPEGYDFALTFAAMSIYDEAIKALQAVTAHEPLHSGAWAKLAELLRYAGKDKAAERASAAAARSANETYKWRASRDLRTAEQLERAERALELSLHGKERAKQIALLRETLAENPIDAAVIHLLSKREAQDGDTFTALALLERTLELAPAYDAARHELAIALNDQRQFVRAIEQTTMLLRDAPQNPAYRARHAQFLENSGDVAAGMLIIEELVRQYPRHQGYWLRYGTLLRNLGKREESARAFRTCLAIAPTMGDAYASLADLKGDFLTAADVDAIRKHLAEPSLAPSSRMRMYYALGHTLEKAGDFSASFAAYSAGARLVRGSFLGRGEAYDEEKFVEYVRSIKRFYSARILSQSQAASANPAAAQPIFVVGMPRAGSTLVEQILASHSRVEGTRELPVIGDIVRDLATARRMVNPNAYPDCVEDLAPAQLASLGESYIARASSYRHTDRACFVDKRPWNWMDAGLIHLILPQAKIIDIRREPMAACFAMFKQQLPKDCAFSYDLRDVGRYYNIYVSLMEHWKAAMPGRIHFVRYERLVEDSENEIRRMLAYCGLPFEESCLRFWETDRPVLTPSAEQVRRPIYRDAVEQWRNFEPWLAPLKAALSEPPLA